MSFVRMLILWRSSAKFNDDAALLLKLLLIRLLNDFIQHKEANPMTNGSFFSQAPQVKWECPAK